MRKDAYTCVLGYMHKQGIWKAKPSLQTQK